MKLILGIVGEIAAGKTTATDYMRDTYGAVSFRFSDMLRDVTKRLHIEPTRGNLQLLSTVLRHNFGEDIMSRVLAADAAESTHEFIITEGVRRPSDVEHLKNLPGFKILALAAEPRTRYERLTKRSENPDDRNKTWDQFIADGAQESEQKIKEIMSEADATITNEGSAEELYKKIDDVIKQFRD